MALGRFFGGHSRPQSPSFLGHVFGKRGVGYKLSRVALGREWYLYGLGGFRPNGYFCKLYIVVKASSKTEGYCAPVLLAKNREYV